MENNISLVNAIAIDGPVAAGKGTIATLLSARLKGFHLYTGAMYRCLALYSLRNNISYTNKEALIDALSHIWFDLNGQTVFMNDEDVTEVIKKREITQLVAKIAAIGDVRVAMVLRQREIGLKKIEKGFVVLADGRDAATKIFPDAKLKVFLTARPEVRAKRRFEQMGGENNHTITLDQILQDTNERDRRDYERDVDPLVKEPEQYGYVIIDNSDMTEKETVDAVEAAWRQAE